MGNISEIRLLGPVEVWCGGLRVDVGDRRQRTVLAGLAVDVGRLVTTDCLIDRVWGERVPGSARNALYGYLRKLRTATGVTIHRVSGGYLLDEPPAVVDLAEFTRLTGAARDTTDPARAAGMWTDALARWRGDPLTGLDGEWVSSMRDHLNHLHLSALLDRHDVELRLGRHRELLDELRELLELHPLDERPLTRFLVAARRCGLRAEAIEVYQRARKRLADELGVEPGEHARDLYCQLLRDAPARPGPVRLKAEVPDLVGREDQLATAARWLRSRTPCIAVTGPGGVGKTAFVTCLAAGVRGQFPDGVLFAQAGPSALTGFLAALDLPLADELTKEQRLWDLLGDRHVLVVLDDVPDERHVRPLLPVPVGCGLVVTSRRRLAGLDALRPLPLDVLPVEAGVDLLRRVAGARRVESHADALVESCGGLPLAIKVVGARLRARPSWTAADLAGRLADTHHRLDWLQLGDVGVRAGLADSIAALSGAQRSLLCRLSLADSVEFAGWVAAALLGQDAGAAERLLDDLVEVHLVEPAGRGVTGPRYRVHELVRLAAREQADDPDDADKAATTRVRHGWFALAAAADHQLAHWFGLDPEPAPAWRPPAATAAAVAAEPLRWFDEEHDALLGAIRHGHDAVAWALAQRLTHCLELRGRYDDLLAVLEWGLAAAEAGRDRQGQATMLGLLMHAAALRDEHHASAGYGARALAAYRALDSAPPPFDPGPTVCSSALRDARGQRDALAVGFAACQLALSARVDAAHVDYLTLFEEARDAFRVGGAPLLELWTIKNTGLVYLRGRRFAEAEESLRRALELLAGDVGADVAGGDLAAVAAAYGRADLAEQLATTAIADARRTGDRWSEGRALITLADLRASCGDTAAAGTYREALAVWRELRLPRRVAQVEKALARLVT